MSLSVVIVGRYYHETFTTNCDEVFMLSLDTVGSHLPKHAGTKGVWITEMF